MVQPVRICDEAEIPVFLLDTKRIGPTCDQEQGRRVTAFWQSRLIGSRTVDITAHLRV